MIRDFFLGVIFAFLYVHNSWAQQLLFFNRFDSVQVKYYNNQWLKWPWAGGMNYVQIHNIDLNYDGLLDLVSFDRTGNRLLPFINVGSPGQIEYVPSPDFRNAFPQGLISWILCKDFNKDGKIDLFTYKNGGAAAFKNTGNAANGLSFSLEKNVLMSDYGQFVTGIYISGGDFPAFEDLDKDGDIDILTFNVFGACLEMHQNLSRELYGHSDSLIFKLKTDNWGHVIEDPNNNIMYLNDSCDGQFMQVADFPNRHSGGSLLLLDVNGNNLMDLVVGDISYSNLTLLINNGSINTAIIGSQNTNFPVGLGTNNPVNLNIFPAAFSCDVNADGKKDLVVSPNFSVDAENYRSVWLYINSGWDSLPNYQFWGKDFLQKDMLDFGEGAFPALADLDSDGLQDLVVGNAKMFLSGQVKSSLHYFKNTGTPTQPQFELLTDDLAGISDQNFQNIAPTFGDLDGDGDLDLLFGESNGRLYWYENIGTIANIPQFQLKQSAVGLIQEPLFSTPQLFDLDEDGLLDIICGHRFGKLNFYRNTGTIQNPVFNSTPTISQLGDVNVIDSTLSFNSFSVPHFFKDHSGKLHLLVGSLNGRIYHYTNISNNISGTFDLVTSSLADLREGARTAPATADITGDGVKELLVGNYSGGLSFFKGSLTASIAEIHNGPQAAKFQVFPNPAKDYVTVTPAGMNYKIKDMFGNLVLQSISNIICIKNLKSGIYWLTVEGTMGLGTQKLIVLK